MESSDKEVAAEKVFNSSITAIPESIARKYADALYRSYIDNKSLESSFDILNKVESALNDMANTWMDSSDLRSRLSRPTVLATEKEAAIFEIGQLIANSNSVQPADYFGRFLVILQQNGRLAGIGGVAKAFNSLLKQLRQELSVKIISASPLAEDEKLGIQAKLEAYANGIYSSLATIEYELDPSLLGGAVIRTDGKQIDGSVKGALEMARGALLAKF